MTSPRRPDPPLSRLALVALILVTVPLAGCIGSGGTTDATPADDGDDGRRGDTDPDGGTGPGASGNLTFDTDGAVRTADRTVTVEPGDACLPLACNTHMATGEHRFIKFVDISDLLPAGTHAYVEAEATWNETVSGTFLNEMNLQWWFEDLWSSGTDAGTEPGRAWIRGDVTSHGPKPAQILLVVIEPENVQPVDVQVSIRVDPRVEEVAPWHPVAVDLQEPTTIEATANGTITNGTFQVRGPDDALVTQVPFEDGTAVADLPPESPSGAYVLHVQGQGARVSFRVPDADLGDTTMRMLDITPETGEARTPPTGGEEVSWSVDLDRPPYWIGVWTQQLDRWSSVENMTVTVDGPNGTLIDDVFFCTICGYNIEIFAVTPGSDELVAGTYTFTVSADVNEEYEVWDIVGTYR